MRAASRRLTADVDRMVIDGRKIYDELARSFVSRLMPRPPRSVQAGRRGPDPVFDTFGVEVERANKCLGSEGMAPVRIGGSSSTRPRRH